MGRDFRLRPYNEYRERFGYNRLRSFNELTKEPAMRQKLQQLYGDIDRVEYVVGLFAEDAPKDALFGDLLNRMVAHDAFTQIYTNPLLSRNVFNAATFTEYGLALMKSTQSIQDLVNRNVPAQPLVHASLGVSPRRDKEGDLAIDVATNEPRRMPA